MPGFIIAIFFMIILSPPAIQLIVGGSDTLTAAMRFESACNCRGYIHPWIHLTPTPPSSDCQKPLGATSQTHRSHNFPISQMPPPDQTSTCAVRCCQKKLHQNKVVPKKFSSKLQASCCIFWSTWTPRLSSLEAHCTVMGPPTRLLIFTQDWPVAAANPVLIAMNNNMIAKKTLTLPIFSATCNHKSIQDTSTRLWHAWNRESIILKTYLHLRRHHVKIGEIHRVGGFLNHQLDTRRTLHLADH